MVSDLFQEILHTLTQNKIRSLLAVFGVFWGMFMFVIINGVGNGLQNAVYKAYSSYAANSFFIWPLKTTKPYNGFGPGRQFSFNNEDTCILKNTVPEIKAISPRSRILRRNTMNNVVYQGRKATLTIYGDEPQVRQINLINIKMGRFLNMPDVRQKRRVAVIGANAVPILYTGDRDPVNTLINIHGNSFKVIGVFDLPNRNSRRYEEDSKAIIIPLSTFQSAFKSGSSVGSYSVLVRSRFNAGHVKEKVRRLIAVRHNVSIDDKRAFGSWNMAAAFKKTMDLFEGIRLVINLLGVLTLMAGVVGISNIMLIIIKEQTQDIGIRRAVGATPLTIIFHVVLETVALTSIPGYTALFLGVWILNLIDRLTIYLKIDNQLFSNPQIDFETAVSALAILTLGGVIASIIPAFQAVRMKPVDALRYKSWS